MAVFLISDALNVVMICCIMLNALI